MSLEIQNAVIHEIIKDTNSSPSINLSDQTLDNTNPNINSLMNKLDDVFKNKMPKRAKLKIDSRFRNFISSNDFLVDSSNLITTLETQLINLHQAKGGYFLFVKYKVQNEFLAVFILRNTEGFITRHDNYYYVVDTVTHLEINKLAMGMRINLDIFNNAELEENKQRYVSLIRGNTEISKYFNNWISLDDEQAESVDANSLMKIANNIDLPDGIDNREDLKRRIGEFANNAINNIVDLTALSSSVFGDDTHLINYCNENNIDIDNEFKMSKGNIKKFFKIIANTDGINVSFGREKIGDSIDIRDDKLIINSPSLVQEINAQIDE